jgi:beta-glucosidase
VLGPNADALHVQGGGSAAVRPARVVSALDGLRQTFPSAAISHEAGAPPPSPSGRIEPRRMKVPEGPDAGAEGILITYYRGAGFEGEVAGQRVSRRSNLSWLGGSVPRFELDAGAWSAKLSTDYRAEISGRHRLDIRCVGTLVVRLDGEVVHDDGPGPVTEARHVDLELSEGLDYRLELDLVPPARTSGLYSCDIRMEEPTDEGRIQRAVDAAAAADVAVVVVGVDADIETEGHDRADFSLPAPQVELIEAVASVNRRTVVVVNVGSPVDMSWADRVAAVLQLWCPGQEGGLALADVLSGQRSASGRLPTTIPLRLEDTPTHGHWPGAEGKSPYDEGVFIGYRHYTSRGIGVRFPFGHGLSYTTFTYGQVSGVPERITPGEGFEVSIEVTNSGDRPGVEVVQLYVSDEEASVARPRRELKGFYRVDLQPGQTATVRMPVVPRDLCFWDPAEGGWKAEPGRFAIEIGASAADIRSSAVTELTP